MAASGRAASENEGRAAPAVRVQGELADDQDVSSDVGKGEVGFAVPVVEDAQPRDLVPEHADAVCVVFVPDTEQDDVAAPDGAFDIAVDRDACVRDALDKSPHVPLLTGKQRRRAAVFVIS